MSTLSEARSVGEDKRSPALEAEGRLSLREFPVGERLGAGVRRYPSAPGPYGVLAAMAKEARVAMLASGAIDVSPPITRTFPFADGVRTFELAAGAPKGEVKTRIEMGLAD